MTQPLVVLLATALLLMPADPALTVGVATTTRGGGVCLAMPKSLPPGATVTLILPTPPQSRITAVVGQALSSCDRLDGGLIAGSFFQLETLSAALQPGTVAVAFEDNVRTRTRRTDGILDLETTDHPSIQVRSCTSSEGLHLTVWAGQALKSRRLWHEYYYLGFDVEPTCEEADTSD